MTDYIWQGGASTTAQIDKATVAGSWAQNDQIRTTLTSEDGSTSQVITTTISASSPSVTDVRDEHLAELQAATNPSTQSLFLHITFAASSTDAILMTTKSAYAGIPNHITVSVPTGSGTYSNANQTASSGPEDVGVAANYAGAAVPTTGGALYVMPHPTDVDASGRLKSYDMKYGLAQGTNLASIFSAPAYFGAMGDPVNGYPLQFDCTSGNGNTVLKSSGRATLLKGTHTQINLGRAAGTRDSFRFWGTATTVRLLGPLVAGTIRFEDSTSITSLYGSACVSANVKVGTSNTITNFKSNAGTWYIEKAITTALTMGTVQVTHAAGAVQSWDHWGGYVAYNGAGDLGNTGSAGLTVWDGDFDFTKRTGQSSINVYNCVVKGGHLLAAGLLGYVSFPDGILDYVGGAMADAGVTISYA